MKEKKKVLRTCVCSKEVLEKKDLFRIIKTQDGNVIVDLKGKVSAMGKGAYLKKDKDVILKAKKTKVLERALETSIPDNIYEEIDTITFYILNYIARNKLNNIAIISTDEYSHLIELNLKKYNLPVNNAFGNKYINNNFVKYFLLIIQCYIDEFKKEVFIDLLNNERISFGYNVEELNNYKIR